MPNLSAPILTPILKALVFISFLGLSACDSGSSNTGGNQAPPVPLVGPDLNGSTWQGHFKNLHGAFIALSATVLHIGDGLIIQTTLPNNGIGSRLEGKISSRGTLLLYDSFDGQDWTTLFGPVSTNAIKIADFIFVNGQNVDTNSIELFR